MNFEELFGKIGKTIDDTIDFYSKHMLEINIKLILMEFHLL